MTKRRIATATLTMVVVAVVSLGRLSGGAEPQGTAGTVAPAPIYSATETATFKTLTKATLEELSAGNNTKMIETLTDLETAWDDQEAVLKPRDPTTWTVLDRTLDKGISALRGSRKDPEKGKEALEDLLKKLQEATKS